jgi:hypothetical protein
MSFKWYLMQTNSDAGGLGYWRKKEFQAKFTGLRHKKEHPEKTEDNIKNDLGAFGITLVEES